MYDTPLLTLAQENTGETSTTEPAKTEDGDTGNPPSLFSGMLFPLLIGGVVLMFILTSSGQRKQKKKHAEMVATMSKGAKVVTMGGIKGSIVEVREDEVVVKVDESNNTRMHFTKDAIRSVLSDDNA